VTPASSYKFAAVLQSLQSAVSTLLRVDYDTGFGPGTPTSKQMALDGDRLTFLVNAIHVTR
jgi:prolyl oligopeptidase PreP (S9A serine peptidase family)